MFVFKWFLWGYSLAFSQTGTKFIGDLSRHIEQVDFSLLMNKKFIFYEIGHAFLRNVSIEPHPLAPHIPCNLYMLYQW